MYVGHGPFTWSWYAESGSQPWKCGVTCEIFESKILEKTHRWHLSTLFWFWISENISLWFTIVLDFYVWQALFHIEHAAAIMPRTWDMLRDPAATMALCIYYIHIIYIYIYTIIIRPLNRTKRLSLELSRRCARRCELSVSPRSGPDACRKDVGRTDRWAVGPWSPGVSGGMYIDICR